VRREIYTNSCLQFIITFADKLDGQSEELQFVFLRKIPLSDIFIDIAEMSEEDVRSVNFSSQSQEGGKDFKSEVIFISEAIEEDSE